MTIEASRLRVDLEEGDHWRRTLSVTVPADLVEHERSKVADRLAGRIKLRGFRAGKTPRSMVEQRFGPTLNRETVDHVIGEAYRAALQIESLRPISEGQVEKVDYEPESDLKFSISFDVEPVLELARLGGFRLERSEAEVTDEQVDRAIHRLREQEGAWQPAETGRPTDGNLVSVSVVRIGVEEGDPSDYDFVLGSGDAIPDVEAAIRTLEPGGSGEFSVRFPEDFSNEKRRGEEERLRILLRSMRVLELPDLDDDLARSVGDLEDLEALRARVRRDLEEETVERQEAILRSRLFDSLLTANPIQVPRSMVDRYMDQLVGEKAPADVSEEARAARERIRPDAEHAVKRILLVDKIADTQGLRANQEDVDARIEEMASRRGIEASEVFTRLQRSGALEPLERQLTEDKVFAFLKGQSEILD